MKRWTLMLLATALASLIVYPVAAQDSLDDLFGESDDAVESGRGEDADEDDEADDKDDDGGDAVDFDESSDKDEDEDDEDDEDDGEKKAKVEASTDDKDWEYKYETPGRIHAFLGIGYAIPAGDTGADGTRAADYNGSAGGGLPIWFGGDYFIIEALSLGLNLRITPLFVTGADFDATANIFDLQVVGSYYLIPSLKLFLGLGFSSVKLEYNLPSATADHSTIAFKIGAGLSYTLWLAEVGQNAGFGLEFGAEFAMMVSPDFEAQPANGIRGNTADNLAMYPLIFIGGRFGFGG